MADTVRMLDVRRMRVLREVAARGTIAAAARALAFTPSAVSQQLAALEREAGVALLDRRGGRVRLTEAGRRLVGRTEAILAELEAATAELEAAAVERRRRRPRRGLPERRAGAARARDRDAGARAMPRCACGRPSSSPRTRCRRCGSATSTSRSRTRTSHGRARPTIGSSARTCSRTRCGSRSRAAGSPASRTDGGSPVALAGLAAERWVATPPGHRLPRDARRRLPGRPASSPASRTTRTTSPCCPAFVAAGLGVALVPGLALPAFGGPEVGIRPVADVPVTRRIFAAARRGGLERPAAAAMVAALRAAAQTRTRSGR